MKKPPEKQHYPTETDEPQGTLEGQPNNDVLNALNYQMCLQRQAKEESTSDK